MKRTKKDDPSTIARADGAPTTGLTRRTLLGSAGALAGVPLLHACGGSAEAGEGDAAAVQAIEPSGEGRDRALALAPAVAKPTVTMPDAGWDSVTVNVALREPELPSTMLTLSIDMSGRPAVMLKVLLVAPIRLGELALIV